MGLLIREDYVNATENVRYGESEVYETAFETSGELYRAIVKMYGRCTSKIYVDTPKGRKHVGWVFVSKAKYEDSDGTYRREVWVTVHIAPDTVTRTPHYATL